MVSEDGHYNQGLRWSWLPANGSYPYRGKSFKIYLEKTENGQEQPEEEFVNPDAEGKYQIKVHLLNRLKHSF